MVYTPSMRQAFSEVSHYCPKGFRLEVLDNDSFLTIRASEKDFMSLHDDGKRMAVEYMVRAKQALEANGAIVLLVREGGEEIV
jgi:hypothetical protein